EIDVRVKRRRTLSIEIRTRPFAAHRATARIDLVETDSFATVENVLVLLFESRFTDRLPRLVAGVLGIVQLRLCDFASVTDERRHDRPVRIVSFRHRLDDQTREIESMLLEDRYDVDRDRKST